MANTETPTAVATTDPSSTSPPPQAQPEIENSSPSLCCACRDHVRHHDPSTSASSPPAYRPIRAPALNIPNRTCTQTAIILAPVPHPQPVPVVSIPNHCFLPPSKRISFPEDISKFLSSSSSGSNFLGFVAALSQSVLQKKISDPLPVPLSQTLESVLSLLQRLAFWVDEIPPVPHQGRYGNPAYRQWHQRLADEGGSLVDAILPDEMRSAVVELLPYLLDSFGNASRIDYGTGHETNFAAFLYCLARIGLAKDEDYQGTVLRVFVKYLELMRKLQNAYSLEPAGSHGVWGLDDYHFLPFVFGSAQLVDHKYMKPKSIHNHDILDNFSHEYMYFECVAFVRKVKKGMFAEHSPLLDDISGVQKWSKVNGGMLKMYKAEVLEKVPIMQHFLFGSLIKWE